MKNNRKSKGTTTKFIDYLYDYLSNSSEMCFRYLQGSLRDKDEQLFLQALDDVINARGGYKRVLKYSSLTEADLKAIFDEKKPLHPTQLKVILNAIDLKTDEHSEKEMEIFIL